MRIFENRVLRRIFWPKRDEVTGGGGGENCIMRSLMICTPHPILFGRSNEMGGACSANGGEERRIQVFGGGT